MRLSNLFIVAACCFFLTPWMFPIDVASSVFPVNPNGTTEVVGALRLVFTGPDFGDPNNFAYTDFYVLVRIYLSDGVHLVKIGGKTKDQITPSLFIPIALERNYGMPTFPTDDVNAVRLIRFDDHYFDLLFTKNMYNSSWYLGLSDTLRVTVGMPEGVVPSDAINNFGGAVGIGTQWDTSFECDFSTSNNDFSSSSFWEVGLSCYHSSSQGVLGSPYNSMFNPSHVALAQSAQFVPLGDLNKDGLVDAVDMAIMANYLTGNMDINLALPSESGESVFSQSEE